MGMEVLAVCYYTSSTGLAVILRRAHLTRLELINFVWHVDSASTKRYVQLTHLMARSIKQRQLTRTTQIHYTK
jgi:hypothetical protein